MSADGTAMDVGQQQARLLDLRAHLVPDRGFRLGTEGYGNIDPFTKMTQGNLHEITF